MIKEYKGNICRKPFYILRRHCVFLQAFPWNTAKTKAIFGMAPPLRAIPPRTLSKTAGGSPAVPVLPLWPGKGPGRDEVEQFANPKQFESA